MPPMEDQFNSLSPTNNHSLQLQGQEHQQDQQDLDLISILNMHN